ncbi:MAG: spermidine/putrescine ABC transporter substrate-binding protein [Bacteroidetes bacterium HGW-Bacteroidetes-1]|jgi:ABC-type Fe3+ transport system substrate-binding protein|nr:MAG: spermidine/putrescine ABC transporter substrate-binding protein [Bacteroidetes bacterium HGW-Bacteroidetes-1]
MKKKYFKPEDTLFDITEKYPQTLRVFISNGFTQLADEDKRSTFGKALQLHIALMMRQLDQDGFIELLETAIEGADIKNTNGISKQNNVTMKGLLPCPVRIPLQEKMDILISKKASEGIHVQADLKAASMGLDWIKEEITAAQSPEELGEIYLSAGFDLFFEDEYFGRFIKSGHFTDLINWNLTNPLFENAGFHLKDPLGRYGIIAVVPAVFLVNTAILGDRPIPSSWEDLLDPIYERSVSLPVSDFDLFNAILLTIDKTYGREAVKKLGRNMLQSLHPAQMVKSERQKENRPAITIMPNFFTKMVKEGSAMKVVWPSDGAIISPIFMIGKTNANKHTQDVANMVSGIETAEILAHQGLFPSLHPDIDNHLPEGTKFLWLGWDYIAQNNLNQKFAECHAAFDSAYINEKVTEV